MGSQHLRVPFGLIRQLCYPGGIRLPRISSELSDEEPELMATSTYSTPGYSYGFTPRARSGPIVVTSSVTAPVCDVPKTGNLANESYRYFKGVRTGDSPYFQCRGCLQEGYERTAKIAHMKDCRELMKLIEDEVRRSRFCVVCGANTTKEKWNLKLCSDACCAAWRFSIPNAYLQARETVIRRRVQ